MSTLQRLIAAVGASTPETFNAEAMALAYYMVDHAADIAERERLEAELAKVASRKPARLFSYMLDQDMYDAMANLVEFVHAHADDGAQTP